MKFISHCQNKKLMILKYLICILALTCSGFSFAEQDPFFKLPKSLQVHGFLSQGFLHSSDNDWFGHSDDNISTDFRELGLNASWRVIPQLQLAIQVVWRNAGQTDNSDLRIDYGVIDYRFYSSESTLLGLKAGRVPTPFGLYNDTRDVASTRPSVLLPQSIYFDRNRNLALSADGGYMYGEQRTDYGDFLLTAGIAKPRVDDPSFKNSLVGNDNGKMEGDILWLTRLAYEWQSGVVRLAVTYADFNADYNPGGNSRFRAGKLQFNPIYFSAQYNAENWSLTAEYAQRKTSVSGFGAFSNIKTTGESFYIQGTYRFTKYLEGLVRYDQLSTDKNDKNGNKFARQSLSGAPDYSRFAKDWTVGLRVSIIPSLLVSAEYHRINGTAWLSSVENDNSKLTQYWDLYTVLVSYNF